MKFTIEESGQVVVARLHGVLEADGVSDLHRRVAEHLANRDRKLVLDFREVDALDPMGLAELLKLSHWVKERGQRLRAAHASSHMEEVFRDNMISDVDFFPDAESACRYSEPTRVSPQPPIPKDIPIPPEPWRPVEPAWRSLIRRHGLLMAIAALLVLVTGGIIYAVWPKHRELQFQTEDKKPWVEPFQVEDLKIGETRTVSFLVRNAESVGPITNEDWIRMKAEQEEKGVWRVEFTFAPTEYFDPSKTWFQARASDDDPEEKSPDIRYFCAEKLEPPKFTTTGKALEKLPDGQDGYPLASGTEGESYGPDGISATGGRITYSASGHEPYGLDFDTFTGKFTGARPKPTPEGRSVPIRITASNNKGKDTITAFLLVEKKPQVPDTPPTPEKIASLFDKEIEKRFKLVDKSKLEPKDIDLLVHYKQIVGEMGNGKIHKVATIFFPVGKTNLDVGTRQKLDAEFDHPGFRDMAVRKDTFFFVLGFADKGTGNDDINTRLIRDRADNLRAYLESHLREDHRLSTKDLAARVRTIPMQPVPEGFDSRERSRAGEIWLVQDPRQDPVRH